LTQSPLDLDAEAERFRLFASSVTDYAIYMLSPDGIVSSWNAGAQRFKGYSEQDILGQHFSVFYTPEDRANGLPARAMQTALTEGKFEDEGWRMRKDGTRFWASVVMDPIRDAEGTLVGFAKITRDITERKKDQEALHASEEKFRLLVQGVTDYAIYMLSPLGEITNWNEGARRIKGYTDTDVIGTHFSRFYTDEDRSIGLPAKALHTAMQEGRYESEGWRVRKDGSRFWAHVVIDPIRSDMGELLGFAKITRDITERRETAEALRKAQEALFQSQKMEAIGKLTGGIAHDFNNLLSVIFNGMAVLRRDIRTDYAVRILDTMERAVTRGSTLTQQLLSFARQQPLQQEKYQINRVITSFEAVLRRANTSTQDFTIELAEPLPMVIIDAPQFEAALLNLVVNARDATASGGSISLTTEAVDLADKSINNLPAGRYVKISLRDTGEGMTPEVKARAIDPFFTTKPTGKGTGLGLSQVYGFIQQSKGDIEIESAPGKGTCVSLYLPAVEDELQSRSEAKTSEKVLVVDDQPDVLDMAAEVFRSLGYEVLSANNAKDALAILQRTKDIHLLFSDVIMPGTSGLELAREAKSLRPDMNVLLASGYASPALGTDKANQDFEFITKPYKIADIMRKLRELDHEQLHKLADRPTLQESADIRPTPNA
jgi:PAS domain S-box-containing protein